MTTESLPKSMPPGFESEVLNNSYYFLIRPCERYGELYDSCKSIRNRINQYYVYGELLDCETHKQNYDNCMMFRKTCDTKLLDEIKKWEEKMILTRRKTAEQNKVWEMRDEPPKDFDSPLPEFIVKRQSQSIFKFNKEL